MTAAQSIVVVIDVEPDPRMLRDPEPWTGFENLVATVTDWRRALARATGAPAAFTWLIRADAQIATVYGEMGWGLRRYRAQLDALEAAGDTVGLHIHFWRRAPQTKWGWISDFADAGWMDTVVREAFAAFARERGRPAEVYSFGSGYMNNRILDLAESLGARIDMTYAPGEETEVHIPADEGYIGPPAAIGMRGRLPYLRSRHDYLSDAQDGSSRLWLFPVTTCWERDGSWDRRPWSRLRGSVERALDRHHEAAGIMIRAATLGHAGLNRRKLLIGIDADRFMRGFRRVGGLPLIVMQARTDIGAYEPYATAAKAVMARLVNDPGMARARFISPQRVVGLASPDATAA